MLWLGGQCWSVRRLSLFVWDQSGLVSFLWAGRDLSLPTVLSPGIPSFVAVVNAAFATGFP